MNAELRPLGRKCAPESFADAVVDALSGPRKALAPKWLYDERGSELFEAITTLDEYYVTRTEVALLERYAGEIVHGIGAGARVVELGAGSALKTPLLIRALPTPAAYAAIDVSESALRHAMLRLRREFPTLELLPTPGDFMDEIVLPRSWRATPAPTLGFFPGSTLGNLEPPVAADFLRRLGRSLGRSELVVGLDTPKPAAEMHAAYDDARGVTAEFNLNLLARINRELGGTFDLDGFRHEARWDAAVQRVEMHLVSLRAQTAGAAGREFAFREGESLHTESSYKYAPEAAMRLFSVAGWDTRETFLAPDARYAIYRLTRR